MQKPSIPLWRMGLYSLLFATACGMLMVAPAVDWKPKVLLMVLIACVMAWVHGHSQGMRFGSNFTLRRMQGELDTHIEKANKDIAAFKAKVNKQVKDALSQQRNEGDEWKQGGADPEASSEA